MVGFHYPILDKKEINMIRNAEQILKDDKLNVEFTDRYNGNDPWWLTACHGDCEAMGYIPVYLSRPEVEQIWDNRGKIYPSTIEKDPELIKRWWTAERDHPSDDGYHFVRCPQCEGTGKVQWYISLTRIPKWIIRGFKFVWNAIIDRKIYKSPWTSNLEYIKRVFKAAWR